MKVGLLLHHMCDSRLKIYSNFVPSVTILREEKRNRRPKILRSTQLCWQSSMHTSRNGKLNWYYERNSGFIFDTNLWFVCYQHERKGIIPVNFFEQAVRQTHFSCKEDSYKLKIYDQGATLSLKIPVKILSLGEPAKRELRESKTGEIGIVTERGSKPNPRTMNNPQSEPSTRICR